MPALTHEYEAIDVAACILGIDEDSESIDEEIEAELDKRWGIDLDTFRDIAECLLKMTPTLQSPLSGNQYHVFGRRDGKGFVALMKTE